MRVDSGGGASVAASKQQASEPVRSPDRADDAREGVRTREVAPAAEPPSTTLRRMADDPSPHRPPASTRARMDDAPGVVPSTVVANEAGKAVSRVGTDKLIRNPELQIRWENTRSAWDLKNGDKGFSQPLKDELRAGGVHVNDAVRPIPPGSVPKTPGATTGVANNTNGGKAEDAILKEYRDAGLEARKGSNLPGGYQRRPDVVVKLPHTSDPRLNIEVRLESKVGYTHRGTTRVASEMASDFRQLADNKAVRSAGFMLEKAGKVVRPLGVVIDAVQLGSAFQADGRRFGENTQRASASLAGGAAGGVAGAIIGQALIPIPGVGAVVGAAVGSWLGSKGGEALLGGLKSLF